MLQATHEMRESYDVNQVAEEGKFPDQLVPELRGCFKEISGRLVELTLRMVRTLAVSLDLPEDYFVRCHSKMLRAGNASKMRSLFYPAIKGTQ